MVGFFTDLLTSFNTIDHSILISMFYGVKGHSYELFKKCVVGNKNGCSTRINIWSTFVSIICE